MQNDLTPNAQGEEALANRPVILLVEDEFLVATEAEDALREAGFDVLGPVGSAAEAVRIAVSDHPALVVMDIRLIGARDGIDAAREIYERVGIRAIFATAYAGSETRKRAEAIAPLGWLPKPYLSDSLVELVRAALASMKT